MKIITQLFLLSVIFSVNLNLNAQEVTVSTIQLDASLSLDGLLMTPDGTLYGTEGFDGSRVFKINLDGTTEVFTSFLNGPIDMDYDTNGNIYVSTFNNARVFRLLPTIPSQTELFAAVTTGPSGVVVNRATGDVYVSHYGAGFPGNGNSIYRITPDGNSSVFAQGNGLQVPVSLAIDEEGNLYAPNIANAKLFKITPDGTVSLLAQLPTATVHPFNIGHIAYANGVLYVTGNQSQPYVYKVLLDGSYEIIAGDGVIGHQDGTGLEARFDGPNGIAASVTGDTLFVSELGNPGVLRMIVLPSITSNTEVGQANHIFQLHQNYPNPFQDETTISYELFQGDNVKITVHNAQGQLVDTLVNQWQHPGQYTISWYPEKLASGPYLFQMEVAGHRIERKAILQRF